MDYLNIALDGSDQKTHKLKDFQGTKIVLFFYPKDGTSGCTTEAKEFSTLKHEFEKKGCRIIGVSRDSVKSHLRFIENADLDLLLLSDKDEKLCKSFDVLKDKKVYGKTITGIVRSTFILDENGAVKDSFFNVKPQGHAKTILNLL